MKIRAVAFDLEGTVVNLEPAHHEAHLRVMLEVGLGLELKDALQLCPHFIGGPHDALMKEIHEASNKALSIEELSRRDGNYYREIRAAMAIRPRDGFFEVLSLLRKRNLKTSIGSLTDNKNAMFILEESGLLDWFKMEMIVLKEDVKELKPAPDVFLETARRMGVSPEEQIVFEDSHNGVLAARRAGSLAIGMPVYNQPEAIVRLVQNGASRIFMDWREIPVDPLLRNLEAGI